MILQAEIAVDMMSKTDVTIIGLLLVAVTALSGVIVYLYKGKEKLHTYISEQAIETLKILNALSVATGGVENKVDLVDKSVGEVKVILDDVRIDIKRNLNGK